MLRLQPHLISNLILDRIIHLVQQSLHKNIYSIEYDQRHLTHVMLNNGLETLHFLWGFEWVIIG